jgi:glucose/arabinose dehydrogenase
LTVARGRFDGSTITELQDIFSCGPGVSGPSRLAWGRDGKLYMTTPSGGSGSSSQDPRTYSGKVLRLNDDGWPIVSLGRSYPGPWQSPTFSKEGFASPVVYWMPSISLSGMTFYTGNKLPKWKGGIFVGGQRTGEIPGTGRLELILEVMSHFR